MGIQAKISESTVKNVKIGNHTKFNTAADDIVIDISRLENTDTVEAFNDSKFKEAETHIKTENDKQERKRRRMERMGSFVGGVVSVIISKMLEK